MQEQSTEEKPTPTKNKRSGSKRLSTLERTAQEGEAILKVRLAASRAIVCGRRHFSRRFESGLSYAPKIFLEVSLVKVLDSFPPSPSVISLRFSLSVVDFARCLRIRHREWGTSISRGLGGGGEGGK